MKNKIGRITYLIIIVLMLAACTPAAAPIAEDNPQPTVDINQIYTAAVQTYEVESTRKANLMPTATEVVLPTATLEPPTATPAEVSIDVAPVISATLWIPASGSIYPTITAILDTNCRTGPDKVFELVGGLRVGEVSEVHGRLRGGGWWYIKNLTRDDPKYCWVWAETTTVTGDIDMVPYISSPPTPVYSKPVVTAGVSVAPASSVVCPTTFVFSGIVTSDRDTTLGYQFVTNNGEVKQSGTLVFPDDGTQTVSLSLTYNADISGWVQLKITSPVTLHSTKAYFDLDCP